MWELFNKYQYISLRRKKYRFTANQLLNRGNFISRLTSDTLVRETMNLQPSLIHVKPMSKQPYKNWFVARNIRNNNALAKIYRTQIIVG